MKTPKPIVLFRFYFMLWLCTPASYIQAQNILRVYRTVDTLASPVMHGRGYVANGDKIAAQYIGQRLESLGVKPIGKTYYQPFLLNVNTFPGELSLQLGNKLLTAGKDYIISAGSRSGSGSYDLFVIDSMVLYSEMKLRKLLQTNLSNKIVVFENKHYARLAKQMKDEIRHLYKAPALIELYDTKLTASITLAQNTPPYFKMHKSSFDSTASRASFKVETNMIKDYNSQNVIGLIEGSTRPDSFIIVSAHYDHLGHMGKDVYFPGANDNASGVSLMLELAAHYAKPENKPRYTMAFIAFGGEEAGLIGSKYFVDNATFDLRKTRFVLNLDLMGTGNEGMTVVNGTFYTKEFAWLKAINDKHDYLPEIKARGKAANSDHYYFSEKGIPSFFCYTLGGISAYHDVYDRAETLPLYRFRELFDLFTVFIAKVQGQKVNVEVK